MNIDYDKLLILSKIYNQQRLTFEPMDEMFKLHNSKDVNRETEAKSNLKAISHHIHEIASREVKLMYYSEEAKEKLDLKDNAKIDK